MRTPVVVPGDKTAIVYFPHAKTPRRFPLSRRCSESSAEIFQLSSITTPRQPLIIAPPAPSSATETHSTCSCVHAVVPYLMGMDSVTGRLSNGCRFHTLLIVASGFTLHCGDNPPSWNLKRNTLPRYLSKRSDKKELADEWSIKRIHPAGFRSTGRRGNFRKTIQA